MLLADFISKNSW